MIVPSIQTGNEIGPDIPEGVEWQSATRNPDGTYTLVLRPEYLARLQAEDTEALKAAARLDVTDRLRADALDEATIAAVAGIYDPWEPGLAVTVGQVLRWGGTVVEVIQAHTTQSDWTPDKVPALFRIFRAPGSVAAWVQPTGAHDAYQIGERVTHPNAQDGETVWIFESAINANTTEPGTDGTFHRWWTPIEPA